MKITSACAVCFSGLSAGSRIKIINLLSEKGRLSVLDIAKHFTLKQPTITHHLQYLKNAGLLSSERKGKNIYYFIREKCKGKDCHVFN